MAFFDGDDFKLYVEGATPGQFAPIKGQRELSHDRTQNTYSRSTKDSTTDLNGAASTGHQVTVAYMPELPDANGATRVHSRVTARQTMRVQIRQAPFADSNVIFDCVMVSNGYNRQYPFRDGVGCQLTLVPAEPPTVDTLPTPPA